MLIKKRSYSSVFPFLFPLALLNACGQTSSSGLTEAWDRRNRPEIFSQSYQKVLSTLPLEASTPIPWSDTYWPSSSAGIAHRWNGSWPDDQFKFPLMLKDEVEQKSLKELATLSPAEKYDLFLDNYEYSLVHYERQRTSPDRPGWEGICHGWAPAAVNFEEPKPVIVENKNGLKIPFGSSDIKALLSLVQGNFYTGGTIFLGGRCDKDIRTNPDTANDAECKDVNAGTFHLILANELGLKKKPFIMDVTRDLEVWNQPVFKFQSKILGEQGVSEGAAPETVKEVLVESEVSYGAETIALWDHLGSNDANVVRTVVYQYRLEINKNDEIIGGEWLQGNRPDFLWAQDKADFSGYFSELKTIYEASIKAQPGLENPIFQPGPAPALEPASNNPVVTDPSALPQPPADNPVAVEPSTGSPTIPEPILNAPSGENPVTP